MKNLGLILSCLAFLLNSCASNELRNSDNPEVVYNEAVRLLEDESYLEAADYISEVRRRFPQSRFAVLAELRRADLDFAQEAFIEAAAGYSVFVDLYPRHAEAPYALYRKALSFFNAAPELIARDQSSAEDAARTAKQFLSRYPNSQYVSDVKEIYENSRMKLAQKEAYVARFYRKKEAYEASIARWKIILEQYSDISANKKGQELLEEANETIAEINEEISS